MVGDTVYPFSHQNCPSIKRNHYSTLYSVIFYKDMKNLPEFKTFLSSGSFTFSACHIINNKTRTVSKGHGCPH
jgi:hypothetical protein